MNLKSKVQILLTAILTSVLLMMSPILVAEEKNAAQSNPEQVANLLKSRLGGVDVTTPVETPAEGIYQTQFGNRIAYLTGNGRYIFIGDMIDLQNQVNLTQLSRQTVAKEVLGKVNVDDLVVYPAQDQTRAVLNVFTDTSCPYCVKLHEEVPSLTKAGIEVRYFPFPRGGTNGPGYQTLKQVWCSKDQNKGLDIAKGIDVGELGVTHCEKGKFVDRAFDIGNQVGVNGTPALFTDSGKKIDGYVPANRLIPMVLNRDN